MSSDPRLCIDCRFAELHTAPKDEWICAHRTSRFQPDRSLVTGRVFDAYQLNCVSARFSEMDGRCGQSGRHWEAR